ncbi:MAG: response regulator transcription factor [Spirochaetales bacterium]|nr:response regulator transcription factor [Spirochaetales bacterium]
MFIGLVENDQEYRQTVKQQLEQISMVSRVQEWHSAEEFLRDSERSKLDLVFLDIMLPLMSGVDLAREIANKQPDLKIIMLSSMNSDGLIFESIKNGALGYVLKSELEDLQSIIETVQRGGAIITPTIALRVFSSFRRLPQNAPDLTERERQVLELMVRGKTVVAVAEFLDLSAHTVQGYVKAMYKKLNVHNRAGLALKARELRLM